MKQLNAFVFLFAAIVTALNSTPVVADVKGQDGKVIDCYCTDRTGSRIELGQTICLQVDGRMFMAQCQMSLNVPMWREVQKGCLSSRLQSVDPDFDAGAIHTSI
jgi:hypothetical protein